MDLYLIFTRIVASLLLLSVIIALGLVLEQIVPAEPGQPARVTLFKIRVLAVFTTAGILIGYFISLAVRWMQGGEATMNFGFNLEPRILRIIVGLLVFDFFYYWFHRFQYEWPLLWEQHKLHHADPALNVTSATLHHWLEGPLRSVFISLPMMFVLNLSAADLGIIGGVLGIWAAVKHANLRIPLGPLTPMLVGPQLHRIHHSIKPKHYDKNFAAFFPIYDLAFGTYCGPEPGEWPATGLPDGAWPKSVSEANAWPFVAWWHRLTASKAGGGAKQFGSMPIDAKSGLDHVEG